ncbi:lytic transglycosylase domain-containing protein [Mycobacterium vicinigordonae]|uniref:Lytic transglycosylase domain-containing protein n=1 Tax=Mycobacterium vicinigordonae TaxID=1719132 RepID=A0A7D6I7G2_9MYCO|nr:lytic transglycosylase domain-containing protein [Mycobacterium vicinigordonae]
MYVRHQEHPSAKLRLGVMRCGAMLFVAIAGLALISQPESAATTLPAAPALAADPALLARDLVADEQTLRDPSSSEGALQAAALREQAAYRAIGRHPEWESTVRPVIPASLTGIYDLNVDARHHLQALNAGEAKPTLPAWRIDPPAPADELLGYYRAAEAATGVNWNYLAAINMVETAFGRISGTSTAGAQGPMQFLPSTFASYGDGGDIHSPRDSVMAAGRMLAANGFAGNHDRAIFSYNHSNNYVGAVDDYAAAIAADPAAFAAYHRWDVYYLTTSGDVLLPVGYVASERIPAAEYLASHPQ